MRFKFFYQMKTDAVNFVRPSILLELIFCCEFFQVWFVVFTVQNGLNDQKHQADKFR